MRHLRRYIRKIILRELFDVAPGKKVIFMAGAPGSGKSTVLKQLGIKDKFSIVNPDDWYEPFLIEEKISLDIAGFTQKYFDLIRAIKAGKEEGLDVSELEAARAEQRPTMSRNMQLFSKARKLAKEKAVELSKQGVDFIIDGTGGAIKEITGLAATYKKMGYDVGMIYVSVPKETSIERNFQRGEKGKRRLHPSAVSRSWDSVSRNLQPYQSLFGENLFFVDNSGTYESYQKNIESIRPKMEKFLQ